MASTPEGKKRSSLNALKHGLTARSPHAIEKLAQEYGIHFGSIEDEIMEYYRPVGPVEYALVRRIARCVWRLQMSQVMEQRMVESRPLPARPGVGFDKILRYERLVDIHLHRALAALQRRRQVRDRFI